MRRRRSSRTARCLVAALLAGAVIVATGGASPATEADGFAALSAMGQDGTTGGAGGETVTVTNQADLARYAGAAEPYTIQVDGAISIEPMGTEIEVGSDKTIIGVGTTGEVVGGGFFLGEGVHNVIIRNLTIRDAPNSDENDWDAIQMDTAHHVWIDHNHLTNMGDGLIDSRHDTSYVTVSWNVLSDHDKVFGIGWTDNVTARLTIHHNWFRDVNQRNPSADNLAAAHLYNNYLQNVTSYGNYSRGQTKMVLENSYFDTVTDPYYPDEAAELVERGSIVVNSAGRQETRGEAFDPSEFYDYQLDEASDVPDLLRAQAGPQPGIAVDEK